MVNAGNTAVNPKSSEKNRVCKYCGVLRSQSEMSWVPSKSAQSSEWIKILGPQFAQNIKNVTSNYICLDHIVNGESSLYRLPKKMKIDPNFVFTRTCKSTNRQICRLCGASVLQRDMTCTPTNHKALKKWIDILGPEFAKNIKKSGRNRICLKHIKNEKRGPGRLPKKVNDIPKKTTNKDDEEVEKKKKIPKTKKVNKKKRTLNYITSSEEEEEEDDIDDPEFILPIPKATAPKERVTVDMNSGSFSQEDFGQFQTRRHQHDNSILSKDGVQKMKPIANLITEKSDSSTTSEKLAIKVIPEEYVNINLESNDKNNSEPMNYLVESSDEGQQQMEFVELVLSKPGMTLIAKRNEIELDNHLNSKSINRNIDNSDEGDVSTILEVSELLNSETVQKDNKSVGKLVNEYFQCRVCDVYCHMSKMTETPTDYDKMLKWLSSLGPEYAENIVKNSSPHYVCTTHLSFILTEVVEMEIERVEPKIVIKQEEPMMSKKKPPPSLEKQVLNIVICRYCGARCMNKNMTNVPKNEKQLLDWAMILGEEFLANVRKYKDNRICWSHFNQRDSTRRSIDNLPLSDEMKMINNEMKMEPQNDVQTGSPRSFLKKCCVCGEMNQKKQMTVAPKQKTILAKWSYVFGLEFLKTCSKDKTNHYICSIHWIQLRDDWKGPLPDVLEKMKRENNGSFEETMLLIGIEETNFQRVNQRCICRYCGVSDIFKNMTRVPRNQEVLLKWVGILGQDFYENVQKQKMGRICWSHFNYRDSNLRNINNLPVAGKGAYRSDEVDVSNEKECKELEIEKKPDLEKDIKIETEDEDV